MTRAALIINDLQGGDYQVVLVDEERFAQIKEVNETRRDPTDPVAYLLLPDADADALRAVAPDTYPERCGKILGTKFTQDHVIEPSEDWPAAHIFALLSVPS